ncbi:MAG: Gfo/Idh/MocA family oxidoreductase [Chloroflexi bacterium]|nr:Gfo/Idh/MocA family oxidoreductase [Chloroflexota bacterium]
MKVGLVGAGLIGKRRAQAVEEFDGSELIVVADMQLDKANLIAQEFGCQAVTDWHAVVNRDDVDVVLVCTPTNSLALISIAAMKNGKHVLCEKPLASNPQQAKQMVDVAQVHNVRLKTGFSLRHHPSIRKAREIFDSGIIGELNFIRCRYGHGGRPNYDKEWRTNPEIVGGGELLDQGVHAVDLFRWFMGDFNQATGFVATRFWDIAPLEDNAFALFQTETGQIASLHASWTQWKNIFSFELFGQEGYILVEGLGGNYGTEQLTLGIRSPLSRSPKEKSFEFRGQNRSFYEEWREFITALENNRAILANGYDGWQALRMVYSIYESSREGCAVIL